MTRAQDTVMPFEIKPLGVRGRVVRLGAVIDDIVHRHDYPPVVSALLAEAIALTAMLGATLKFEGKFILQTKTDGPVDMIVADFMSPDGVRGYARFNKKKLEALTAPTQQDLLGKGYLAMTVDQGSDMERYQGIVPLDGTTLASAADTYFKQSEQIPTRLRLVSGPLLARGEKTTHWRAGAIMVQHLPPEGGISPIPFSSGDNPEGEEQVPEDDNWVKAKLLLDTVEDHELLDPTLTTEELLFRLYHEDGVTVYPAGAIIRHCTCSPDAVQKMLKGFSDEDRKDMIENGEIKVICEFCSTAYRFDPETLEPLTSGSAPTTAS
jgi:molecular chaperone Hsp33